jgi:hypothetical protein
MPNPANEASQAAKEAGLSYWDYMEKTFPGCVQKFVWGPAKVEVKRPWRSRLPRVFGYLNFVRNLVGRRY